MALITCQECSRSISEHAVSCPGCGAPVSNLTHTPPTSGLPMMSAQDHSATKNAVWGTIIGLLIVIAGALVHEDLPGYGQLGLVYSLAFAVAGIGALVSIYRLANLVTTTPWLWLALCLIPVVGLGVLIYLLTKGFLTLRTKVSSRKALGY